MEKIKNQWLPGGRWEERDESEDGVFLGQWKYPVYYNDGYMPSYFGSNSQNVQHQEWTLR